MSIILSMEGVSLSFGSKRVLDGLTFAVERGECFGFLGPSGAGKTTTIKLLTRQLAKDAGRINLFGRPIENASDADYERIGILSDTSALYERMSIEDNLKLYAKIRGKGSGDIERLLERMNLADDRKTLIKNCSKGMRSARPSWRRLSTAPSCCSWMSPPVGSIRRRAPRCTACSQSLRLRAPRSSSPRTIWRKPTRCATASPFWMQAAS